MFSCEKRVGVKSSIPANYRHGYLSSFYPFSGSVIENPPQITQHLQAYAMISHFSYEKNTNDTSPQSLRRNSIGKRDFNSTSPHPAN